MASQREKHSRRLHQVWHTNKPFYRCGRKHDPQNCPARAWECYKYHKKVHTRRVCHNTDLKLLNEDMENDVELKEKENSLDLGLIAKLENGTGKSLKVKINTEGKLVNF